ncbi:thioredoxin family protein [Muricauda sp. 334s03]|uniref:Thioredoxin family protein n=1 Tax=Flagellimonas yonaguniensis TaxID=3031325 RepID=A0ABT5Y356_9FLAO|nr:thioredoxin family protein [[Muricauda] yonaguniensis]MDF0717477.1 thioredoxin family protein [[Muricauda] yonaguniensis]
MLVKKILLSICSIFMGTATFFAQSEEIRWIKFEQLEDSLFVKPKKVFIFFNAEWCGYCKKMEQAAFKDPKIVSLLNSNYHTVKMDVETADTIVFDGQRYINNELGKKRAPIHQIPKLLASRETLPFSIPAIILLDAEFIVQSRYFEYMSPKQLYSILAKRKTGYSRAK